MGTGSSSGICGRNRRRTGWRRPSATASAKNPGRAKRPGQANPGKSGTARYILIVLVLALLVPSLQAAGVKINKADGHFTVTADIYTAQVDAGGGLTSLVILGTDEESKVVK